MVGKMSNHPACAPYIPKGESIRLDASVVASVTKDRKGKVIEWRDLSGNGNHFRSKHFHPMQRIKRNWW